MLAVDSSAMFVQIGLVPHTAWAGGQIPLDEKGLATEDVPNSALAIGEVRGGSGQTCSVRSSAVGGPGSVLGLECVDGVGDALVLGLGQPHHDGRSIAGWKTLEPGQVIVVVFMRCSSLR